MIGIPANEVPWPGAAREQAELDHAFMTIKREHENDWGAPRQ